MQTGQKQNQKNEHDSEGYQPSSNVNTRGIKNIIKKKYPLRGLRSAAIITTALVIVAGFAMISPMFLQSAAETKPKQKVLLGFSISQNANVVEWCESLSSLLNTSNVGAGVFIVGKVAEQHPECVSCFDEKVDIGSQTYSDLDLTAIDDYSLKLKEVEEGKKAVDKAGNLYSRAFRAPFGATDQDIYSLLSRSGIMADFSYESQYNIYQGGQFVKYNAVVYFGRDHSPDFFSTLSPSTMPLIIFFDNTDSIASIKELISSIKKSDFEFVNPSDLAGFVLTTR